MQILTRAHVRARMSSRIPACRLARSSNAAGKRDFHHNATIGDSAVAMRRTLGVITTSDTPVAFERHKACELGLCHLEGVGICVPGPVTSGQACQHYDEGSAA